MFSSRTVLIGVQLGVLLVQLVHGDEDDPCTQAFQPGPCRAEKHVVKFDLESGSCIPAVYGGCKGNGNRFSGITECEETCKAHLKVKFEVKNSEICSLPPLTGDKTCLGIFPRFTYNGEVGRCESYLYGGCSGSQNLYITQDECIKTCINTDTTESTSWSRGAGKDVPDDSILFPPAGEESESKDENICSLPPILPGPMGCLALVPKWTFSTSDGKCVQYIYGGCRGTKNLFDTESECRAACSGGELKGRTAEVCQLPIKPGPCRGMKSSFGFNSFTGRCEAFVYGGCQGNENRFGNMEECVNTCGGETPLDNTDCSSTTCDIREATLQKSKGCIPITKAGECCPSSWDCSSWENRLNNLDKCFAVSPAFPSGKFYNVGDKIDMSAEDGCRVGCFCDQKNENEAMVICASVDCFDPRQTQFDRCVPQYKSVHSCCADEFKCDDEVDELGECEVDGKIYKHGEKMYPHKDPCLVCLCQAGWDGSLSSPQCSHADCGLSQSPELLKGCQPIYRDDVCCPVDWVCPAENNIETPSEKLVASESALKPKDRCLLPGDSGECSDLSFRYYFDKDSRRCVQFEGCPGEYNNFDSSDDCNTVCKDLLVGDARILPGQQEEKKYFKAKEERCESPVAVGKCRSRLKKFYYDVTSGKCNEFYYSGCQGGENMFDDLRDCVITCVSPSSMLRGRPTVEIEVIPEIDPCSLEMSRGPCRAIKSRWFFNKNSGNCERFDYSGCQGNENNFLNLESCLNRCRPGGSGPFIQIGGVNTLPVQISGSVSTVFPGAPGATISCPGCPSDAPIDGEVKKVAVQAAKKLVGISSVVGEECAHVKLLEVVNVKKQVVAGTNFILTLKMTTKTGPDCQDEEIKICSNIYAYKPLPYACDSDDHCIEIIRSGDINCHGEHSIEIPLDIVPMDLGEGRNMLTITELNIEEFDPCLTEKMIGDCRAAITRFFFDKESSSCVSFNYGGCNGNDNNFVSAAECEKTCAAHLPASARSALIPDDGSVTIPVPAPTNPICNKPMDAGPCFALKPRYYYNTESKRCEEFLYGGCRGNENNFEMLVDCVSTCGKQLRSRFPPLPPPLPKCKFGNESYAIGDIVRLDSDPCKACVCSSPPDLSCNIKKCPAIAPASRTRENCVIVKDDLGCCTERLECPDDDSSFGIIGGSFPILGAPASAQLDSDAKMVAGIATKKLLGGLALISGVQCQGTTLLEVLDVKKQVVAGTNYIFTMRLKSKNGPLCSDEMDRYCKNIRVHKPLPSTCQELSTCLELINQDGIQCFDTREEVI